MSTVEKSMGRTVDITTLPNHINNEHVHIFRWLDIVHEHRGYGLVGKVGVFRKTIDNHGYFY